MSDYQTSLRELGYRLTDNGDSWRAAAHYRGGDNQTSLMIYKNSGVWYDFAQGLGPLPFRKLVELTLGEKGDIEKFLVEAPEFSVSPQDEFIEMSKIYPESILDDLLPSYKFYLDKKISEETLKKYKCGFASGGKLYRRIVFPIYNNVNQIIGFSGRKVDQDNNAPKWKHLGKRREWVYPVNISDDFRTTWTNEDNELIFVESIGDSLALTENGYQNHLVLFGLTPSSKILGWLLTMHSGKIIISTNNDFDSKINRGEIAAVKTYLSLLSICDKDRLEIRLPLANDFGDMHEAGVSFKKWEQQEDKTQEILSNTFKNLDWLRENKVTFTAAQRKELTAIQDG